LRYQWFGSSSVRPMGGLFLLVAREYWPLRGRKHASVSG
jgi:hypothetical protein